MIKLSFNTLADDYITCISATRDIDSIQYGQVSQFPLSQKDRGADAPGGRPQGRDEGLQQTPDEAVGILPGHHEVKHRQHKEAVDEETHDDRHGVHPQLTAHLGQILHLHNFPCDQEQDAHRSVPGGGIRGDESLEGDGYRDTDMQDVRASRRQGTKMRDL